MKTTHSRYIIRSAFFALVCAACAWGSISQLVVFGDSMSDNGNAYQVIGYPTTPPYWQGRHSNGPVAVEYMANKLRVPLVDFAFDGATTGVGNVDNQPGQPPLPGMTESLAAYLGSNPVDPAALYVVWGGPNDFASITGPGDAGTVVEAAAGHVLQIAGALRMLGATKVYIFGTPDLSLTPKVKMMDQAVPGAAMLMHVVSGAYNQGLKTNAPAVGARFFDTDALFQNIYLNPAMYGLSNVTDMCLAGNTPCGNPDQYLFWDWFHPTTRVHGIMADAFVASAIPEPEAVYLVVTGLVAAVAVRRGFRRRL